jgi:hypothetical protein
LPVTPVAPLSPVKPVAPVAPLLPVKPAAPVLPVKPVAPISPVKPVAPLLPVKPAAVNVGGATKPVSCPDNILSITANDSTLHVIIGTKLTTPVDIYDKKLLTAFTGSVKGSINGIVCIGGPV